MFAWLLTRKEPAGLFPSWLGVASVLLISTSCVQNRLDRRLERAEQDIREDREALEAARSAPQKSLKWNEATRLLMANNQRLRSARDQVDDLERSRKRFLLDQFNPRMSAVANLSSALGSLAGLDSNDYGIRLFGTFNVPNPLTAYARRYNLELQYYTAVLSLHELERRLHASLYGYFLQSENLDDSLSPKFDEKNLSGLLKRILLRKGEEHGIERRKQQYRAALNRELNTPGANWKPDVSTLPRITYEGKLHLLNPQKGYGRLAMKQAAGQVEASLANLWRVKLERLPNFSTGVSMPTLYDSRYDEDGFETDEIRLFGSVNESIDLSGRDAENARSAERRAELVQESVRSRLEREILQLDQAKSQYELLLEQRDQMRKLLRWMSLNPPPAGSSELVLKRVKDTKDLREELKQNEMRRQQMNLEFWIWDESYWKSPF